MRPATEARLGTLIISAILWALIGAFLLVRWLVTAAF